MAPRNKVAPEKKFHKPAWKGKDRTNPNSDPFFARKKHHNPENKESYSQRSDSEPFFVSKKEKSEILEKKNQFDKNKNFSRGNKFNNTDNSQGFFKNKRPAFDKKFKSGKVEKGDKKPFDKKTWRLQKYSKKYKLDQWEDNRKKAVLRGYYREIKDDHPKTDVQKIYEQYDSDNETEKKSVPRKNYVQNPDFVPDSDSQHSDEDNEDKDEPKEKDKTQSTNKKIFKGKPKNIAYKKAQSEFQRIQDEKKAKKDEIIQKKAEKEKALLEYKKKKTEKFKKLNKKTKRGQPIMKDRIEMLLEKIQSS